MIISRNRATSVGISVDLARRPFFSLLYPTIVEKKKIVKRNNFESGVQINRFLRCK